MLRPNCLLVLAAAATVAAGVACTPNSTPSSQDESSTRSTASALGTAPTGPTPISDDPTGTLQLPIPGSTFNSISDNARRFIVEAVLEAKKTYYDDKKYASSSPGSPPDFSEVASVPCGGSYGYLVCNFYAHMPSYASVTPNVRGCFSYMANGGLQVPQNLWGGGTYGSGTTRAGTYAEAFDHCLYNDYDAAQGRQPAWDTGTVAANKAAGTEVGVLKYLSPRVRAAFKFVMYTWYQPDTYKNADQVEIVDEIYKAYGGRPLQNYARTRHQDADSIYIPAMNDYIAAHGGKL
jgi:hypothetical protein